MKNPREWQGNGRNGCLSGAKPSSRLEDLSSHKSQRQPFLSQGISRDTGNLAHVLAFVLNLGTGGRSSALHFESHKRSMHRSARANPLHNLLAYIAALGEIEGAILPGFLRKYPLADVLSKLGNATQNAEGFDDLRLSGNGSGFGSGC